MQRIDFPAHAGRLLRFRVLSVQNPEGDGASSTDPMVTAHRAVAAPSMRCSRATSARSHCPPSTFSNTRNRSDRPGSAISELPVPAALASQLRTDQSFRGDAGMRMNGLQFRRGLGVGANSRIDLRLQGGWHLLRADLGIDDACRNAGGLQFQVWGDNRLLYDSGLVAPGGQAGAGHPWPFHPEPAHAGCAGQPTRQVCANWANAVLIGQEGDSASIVAP